MIRANVLSGKRSERLLEAGAGWLDEAGADLADARLAMGDPRVDLRKDPRLHDLAHVDAGRRAAELEGRDPVRLALRHGDLVHERGVAERVGGAAAHELDDGRRARHREAADPR